MNTLATLPTAFAPAERATAAEIRRQQSYFQDRLLRRMLDAVPDIVLVLNTQRQIVFTNRPLLNFLGLESDASICGLRPGEALGCVHASQSKYGCGTTEFCSTCGAVRAILVSLQQQQAVEECRIVQKNGDALDLRVWATPLELHHEIFSIFSLKDISHEKRRYALERIFFHDLLNTASGLHGFASLLPTMTAAEQVQMYEVIFRLAEHLVDEINAQQELLAAENQELIIQLGPLNSVKFLEELISLYQHRPVAADRFLRLVSTAQAVEFVSDRTLLGRVLGNLIKNALEASHPTETVTIDCTAGEGFIEFSVHNPAFMPRSTQLQIFKRSFSTKGPARGLGTYSIRLLSERYLKGQVGFTSTPAAGTTFTVRCPRILGEGSPITSI